jgi:hypothetical protein
MRQEITLASQTGSRNLDLSLLRVSKQLNEECKELLWGRNTVFYKQFDVYRHTNHLSETGLGPLAAARRVALHVGMTIGGINTDTVAGALKALGSWSRAGSLEEVILIVVNERRKPFQERDIRTEQKMAYETSLERLIRLRTGKSSENLRGTSAYDETPEQVKACFQRYLSVLRDARDGSLAHLKRKMIVNTNFEKMSSQGQHKYLREALIDPNELMMELNEAFGGELWIDGRLWFQDGEQVREAFEACHEEDCLEVMGPHGAHLVVSQHEGVSKIPKEIDPPLRATPDRTPWGQLLEVHASVLDVVE